MAAVWTSPRRSPGGAARGSPRVGLLDETPSEDALADAVLQPALTGDGGQLALELLVAASLVGQCAHELAEVHDVGQVRVLVIAQVDDQRTVPVRIDPPEPQELGVDRARTIGLVAELGEPG